MYSEHHLFYIKSYKQPIFQLEYEVPDTGCPMNDKGLYQGPSYHLTVYQYLCNYSKLSSLFDGSAMPDVLQFFTQVWPYCLISITVNTGDPQYLYALQNSYPA